MKSALVLTLLSCTLFITGCSSVGKTNLKFDALLLQIWQNQQLQDDDVNAKSNALPDLAPNTLASYYQSNQRWLKELDTIAQAQLTPEQRINWRLLRDQVQEKVDSYQFHAHFMPLTSEFGFHSALTFIPSGAAFKTEMDYRNYIAKLTDIPRYFQQNMYWMEQGIATGITQPQAVLLGYDETIKAFIVPAKESVFWTPFTNMPSYIDQAVKIELMSLAEQVINSQVVPAYRQYLQFFNEQYYPAARTTLAASSLPDGVMYYQNRVGYYTTTTLTVEEIHQLGLQEVARIRSEMQEVIAKTGFRGSFADFIAFLRTAPKFYASSPEQLLKEASYIAKKMDAMLPTLFKTLPRMPYGVAPVPDSIAPKYTTGRYVGSNRDDTAGYYWVNTYALDRRPLYELEALTLHEAVPGHHLQIALNAERTDLPAFRRHAYISAFGEGWGLYSEWLGLEAGFYQDPYSNFGRLTYEMWRACRLVIDTGIHAKGWTREQAIAFMQQNTALSLHNIETETDRYISWPGQALAYKIGELTIKKLRREAELALGNSFDKREFHDEVLKRGSIPLALLEEEIRAYVERKKRQ